MLNVVRRCWSLLYAFLCHHVGCGKLQWVAACCSGLWQVAVGCGKLQWVVACFSERLQGEVGC